MFTCLRSDLLLDADMKNGFDFPAHDAPKCGFNDVLGMYWKQSTDAVNHIYAVRRRHRRRNRESRCYGMKYFIFIYLKKCSLPKNEFNKNKNWGSNWRLFPRVDIMFLAYETTTYWHMLSRLNETFATCDFEYIMRYSKIHICQERMRH